MSPFQFRSPLLAQFWIEWRRNGRLALGALSLGFVLYVAGSLLFRFGLAEWPKSVVDPFSLLAMLAIPVWVAITGLNLARDGASKRLALSSFTATRPLPTGTLLTAKLLAGAALWIFAVVIVLGGGVAAAAIQGIDLQRLQVMEVIIPLLLSLHVFVGILPFCLSGRIPGFPWSLLPLLIVYGAVLNANGWLQRHTDYSPIIFFLLLLLVVTKLAVAFLGFRRALGLKLISPRFVVGYVALWLAGTGLLAVLAWEFYMISNEANDSLPLIPAALLVLPLARIALSPLALAMNRHR